MSRLAVKIELNTEEADELNRWLKSGKTEQRRVERAKIVLRSAEGKTMHQIAKELGYPAIQGEQVAQAFRQAEGSWAGR